MCEVQNSLYTLVSSLRTGTSLRSLRIDIELVNSHCDIVYQLQTCAGTDWDEEYWL